MINVLYFLFRPFHRIGYNEINRIKERETITAFEKTNWKDHVTEHSNRYTMKENPDGTVDLIRKPGAVVQQGTPVSASKFE